MIDDIWSENQWEDIKRVFPKENNLGSRIITTTRIVSVSKACCVSANDTVHQMDPLSDDDSMELFHKTLLPDGCRHEFEQVSRDILRKCGGVPLAITTVARLLKHRHEEYWHILLKSIGRGLIDRYFYGEIREILSLSYHDLPRHLKTFLLYLSIFPGSHPDERDRLVKKWITEGIVIEDTNLIGSSNKEEAKSSQEISPEETASQYLDELVNRNVILPLERNDNSEVITYHIHPMMSDVLKVIAMEENFACFGIVEEDIAILCPTLPHISIHCPESENLIHSSGMTFDEGVRSLTVFGHANRFLLGHFRGIRVLDLQGCMSIERADLKYICSMVQLKQLCLAKTRITELPPQIANLKYLEGIDVRGTEITELPPQICNLKYLKEIAVGGTQITQLPPEIGKLQNLKTLDARKSRVKNLPDQVVRLTKLVHLLIGDNESREGVKLPDGNGNMTSLQQLCTIDLRKCSASSLKELGGLPYLKEIEVVSGDEPADTRLNNVLVSSLNKSAELRSLVVYSDFRLSTLQSSSPYKYLNCRKKLTVASRSLKVPVVLSGQRFLRMLDVRVCKLEEDDLRILRELPRLQNLIVRLEVLPRTPVSISCEGFSELESFCVDCRMPRVIFEEGAMPKLGNLELKLYAGSAREKHMGIKHLLNLQEVRLRYFKWCATNKGVRETTEAVKTGAKEHQNKITFCIAEENKDGTCTMKTEIFQENKDAGCSTKTEAEQEDGHADGTGYFLSGNDTQEGDNLHQSSHASAIH